MKTWFIPFLLLLSCVSDNTTVEKELKGGWKLVENNSDAVIPTAIYYYSDHLLAYYDFENSISRIDIEYTDSGYIVNKSSIIIIREFSNDTLIEHGKYGSTKYVRSSKPFKELQKECNCPFSTF